MARQAKAKEVPSLEALRTVLPGLGDLKPIPIADQSPARGKTLAELNLRGRTGASVVAIRRGENSILVPTGREALKAGDVLALAGTHEAIERARSVLQEGKLV